MEPSTTAPLMYHGTHSMFCARIEHQGFCFESFKTAYWSELQTIVAACDELDFKPDGYAAAKGISNKHLVYFSSSFRLARGYALNVGGERVDGALRAATKFLAFAHDERRVELKAAELEAVLNQHGPHRLTERVVASLRNTELVQMLANQVENARAVLNRLARQGHPIVYAVRADRNWKRGIEALTNPICHEEPCGGIELAAVSADRIVARIEYPNGISPDSE